MRAVLMIGRAMAFKPSTRLGGAMLFEGLDQAGFANAGFAAEQHDLAFAAYRPIPALLQNRGLIFSPDQRRQTGLHRDIEAALRLTLAQHSIYLNWSGQAF